MVIRCAGLTKAYGSTLAVDGLDLEVGAGQVYGFLGPNGAGKTTTIRMLLGLVRPTSGRAWVLDRPVPSPAGLAEVGSMIEEPAFYPWKTGRANLEICALTGGRGGRGRAPGAIDRALERAGLAAVADRKVKTYSQGMRQRLGLAAALLGDPPLLLLDEPTNGLDPAGIHEVRGLLRSIAGGGGTVFVSSHLLAEVEQVCDRVAVLVQGRLVEEAPVALLGADRRRVRVVVEPGDVAAARAALQLWRVECDGALLTVQHGVGREINAALVAAGVIAESVAVVQPGLEERFLELSNREGERAAALR
ncbi:MAG TPA: ATP-binding cassette domain-containing protein [Actinomycetota bacterium]|nr:ATP-binding cassette domain-containing protein [Actinomycetota bacterium]